MGRIIAIDYGKKRTGLAVSDPLKIIAGGLATVASQEVIAYLTKYIKENDVELLLVGEPRQMNYLPSENMLRVEIFKEKLQKALPAKEIKMVDERFTSVLAHRTMIQAGLKKTRRQDKALADEVSATILLQTYLESTRK
ncbi:MAG: Holliday junction resolvase RuvX [Candidatus Azobacteroides sp.]|nr:Holliday junction resolvase RuvX [Candidatus Azobacteroides sp.]